jgi:uncharacterized protein
VSTASLDELVGFGRRLRRQGLAVGTGRVLSFVKAAAAFANPTREDLYWAGLTTMIARPEDRQAYEEAFSRWWLSLDPDAPNIELSVPSTRADRQAEEGASPADLGPQEGAVAAEWSPSSEDEEAEGGSAIRIVASAAEALRHKSFALLTEDERTRVWRLIRKVAVAAPTEETRRTRPARAGSTIDMRRTLRRSLKTQGEPFERAWRERRTRTRPLVLVLDVSGSMAPYARALAQFAYAAMRGGRRVEVFCFGTRLTRITRTLRERDPDVAMAEVGSRVGDWEGGTLIGRSIKTLLDGWSQRAALRGAVVVICSDGLERDDPDLLGAQMARLHRLAYRVIWANPLKGSPHYEPLARGITAALPSVDVFLSGHDLDSLEALGRAIAA